MPQQTPFSTWFWKQFQNQFTGQDLPAAPGTTASGGDTPGINIPGPNVDPNQLTLGGFTGSREAFIGSGLDPNTGQPLMGPPNVTNINPWWAGGYGGQGVGSSVPGLNTDLTFGQQVFMSDPNAVPFQTPPIQPGDTAGPPPGSGLVWNPTEQAWVPQTSADLSASPAGNTGTTGTAAPGEPDTSGAPAGFQALGLDPSGLPNAPGYVTGAGSPGIPDAQGNIIPGTAISPQDAANMYNFGPTPNTLPGQGFFSNLGKGIGTVAGDIASGVGTVAGDVGNFFGGLASSISDPASGFYSPDYLSAMGYTASTPESAFQPDMSGIPIPDTGPVQTSGGGGASAGAIALGLGPLPGATVGGSGSPTNVGSAALQNAIFHGIWGGKAPMDYNTWNAGAGTPMGWAAQVGGNYQNYLNIWNKLRSGGFGGPSAPPEKGPQGSGSVPGGAGRPATSPT